MSTKTSDYDYIRVRVSQEERAKLATMVVSGEVARLSDAMRKLAFENKTTSDIIDLVQLYLQHIAELHQELRLLIYAHLDNQALHEHEIIQMERAQADLIKEAAQLVKTIRQVI